MFHRDWRFIGVAAVLAAAGAARGHGSEGGGGFESQVAVKAALTLARAADADGSGDVTGSEWSAFVTSLGPDGDGVIDPNSLIAALSLCPSHAKWWSHHDGDDDDDEQGDDDDQGEDEDDGDHACPSPSLSALVLHLFDRDFDGRIGTDDLNSLFALIDTNGDGALSADEIAAASGPHDQALDDATRMALLLAQAADADKSGDVTADEWTAFLATVDPDGDGVVDFLTLVAALPTSEEKAAQEDFDPVQSVQRIIKALDRDGDGQITTGDLNALFALLDTDGDGAISAGEFASAGGASQEAQDARRLATLLARAADADMSGDVTADEWTAFLATLDPDGDGVIDFLTLVGALPTTTKSEPDPAQVVDRLLKAFDRDGDGQITTGDLNALFALLDTDGDGALSSEELVPPKALRMVRAASCGLLCRAADTDRDGVATSSEVDAFFAGIGYDSATGAVDMHDLASVLPRAAGRRKARLVRMFDLDRDGVVTLSDLHTIFSAVDLDRNGTIGRAELRRALRRAR